MDDALSNLFYVLCVSTNIDIQHFHVVCPPLVLNRIRTLCNDYKLSYFPIDTETTVTVFYSYLMY